MFGLGFCFIKPFRPFEIPSNLRVSVLVIPVPTNKVGFEDFVSDCLKVCAMICDNATKVDCVDNVVAPYNVQKKILLRVGKIKAAESLVFGLFFGCHCLLLFRVLLAAFLAVTMLSHTTRLPVKLIRTFFHFFSALFFRRFSARLRISSLRCAGVSRAQ